MNEPTYVAIDWRDAVYLQNHQLEDLLIKDLPLVRTVGELVHEDRKKIVVCCHKELLNEKAIQVRDGDDFMVIPKTWIEARIDLVPRVEE